MSRTVNGRGGRQHLACPYLQGEADACILIPMENPLYSDEINGDRLAWYRQARFGMFIHWGPYSLAGVEASWAIMAPGLAEVMFGSASSITEAEYTALPAQFDPVDFDPRQWVRLAWDAGMRYMVFTAKHHDGFCMFDAPGTDYKITCTPYGKDICLELARACAEIGMRLGFYYSPPDMHHPGYRDTRKPLPANWTGEPRRQAWGGYLDYMESHLRKLLSDYGPVSVLWFDGLFNHAKYDPPRFHKLIRQLSPETLVNDRLGAGYDFITPEQFIPRLGIPVRSNQLPGGGVGVERLFRNLPRLLKTPLVGGWLRAQMEKYASGELELTKVPQEPNPDRERFQPWETCMTMGQSWAYHPGDEQWKPPAQLLRSLVEVVSRGGNYLLNVGPTPQGTFPPQAVSRLNFFQRWMATNGEAIHGASYTRLQDWTSGRATAKGGAIYLHVFDWPEGGRLEVADFPGLVKEVSLLSGEMLKFEWQPPRLHIQGPAEAPDGTVSVIRVAG